MKSCVSLMKVTALLCSLSEVERVYSLERFTRPLKSPKWSAWKAWGMGVGGFELLGRG